MSTSPAITEDLDLLIDRALTDLRKASNSFVRWVESVRARTGAPGFRWATQSTRDANVASTAYILGALKSMGVYQDIIGDEEKERGIAWVRAMCLGNEQYRDPALVDRKTPGWPDQEPWPSPAMQAGINQYAQGALNGYGNPVKVPPAPPPPGWPQPYDTVAALKWIESRPWDTDPWGAGSHAMRMATWLLQWYKEGHIPLEPLVQALRFFYRTQDPKTGLWGNAQNSLYQRINGTFKLFPLIREQLDLPLPYADRIIDQVLSEFYRQDYDHHFSACDEWDNWYVMALALPHANGHRLAEIRQMAAHRISRVIALCARPDGGLSFTAKGCCLNWIGFDMVAEPLAQGDAIGAAAFANSINVCIDLLDLAANTGWTGQWRMRSREPEPLRTELIRQVFAEP